MSQDTLSPSLVASPEPQSAWLNISGGSTATGHDGYNEFTIHRQEGEPMTAQHPRTSRAKVGETHHLHPYVQTLSLSDLESCVALENAVFPEEERCSREKVAPSPICFDYCQSSFDQWTFYLCMLCIRHCWQFRPGNSFVVLRAGYMHHCRPLGISHIVCIALVFISSSIVQDLSENNQKTYCCRVDRTLHCSQPTS